MHALAPLLLIVVALLPASTPEAVGAAPAPPVLREIPNQSLERLLAAEVDVVGPVVDVNTRRERGSDRTLWTFLVEVERVHAGADLAPGARIEVHAWTEPFQPNRVGSTGHRATFGGTSGLPRNGDRVRVHAKHEGDAIHALLPNGIQPAEPLVAFVAADDEYRSEISMPMLAATLATATRWRTALILAADPTTGAPDVASKTANTGLSELGSAHAAVLFLRYSKDEPLAKALDAFASGGRPVIGFRTSTHAFAFGADHGLGHLDEGFGERLFGTPWRWHHGHGSGTRLLPPAGDAAEHPILRGVGAALASKPVVPSWLYVVEPLPEDCRVLLWGESADPAAADHPMVRQPILWIRESEGKNAPRRMAYTSLGHPGDFGHPAVRRMALQMVVWALGEEQSIPAGGLRAEPPAPYDAPPTR